MDTCSYFINNKALFGGFPSQEKIDILEKMGVIYFVNLTVPGERGVVEYKTVHTKINYPIRDYSVPINTAEYKKFIARLCDIINSLKDGEKIYIHCKGGHGRCGVVVASILCIHHNIDSEHSLHLTNKYQSDRKIMREKWRMIGSPQTLEQKNFVRNFVR